MTISFITLLSTCYSSWWAKFTNKLWVQLLCESSWLLTKRTSTTFVLTFYVSIILAGLIACKESWNMNSRSQRHPRGAAASRKGQLGCLVSAPELVSRTCAAPLTSPRSPIPLYRHFYFICNPLAFARIML